MEKKRVKSLKELVAEKQIFSPIVWNVLSARAVEAAGFEATLLSGGVVHGLCGMPDIGLMTSDDLIYHAAAVCGVSGIPCCIDADDAYGETALHAYRQTKRLIDAGAKSQTLDDTTGWRGYARWGGAFRNDEGEGEGTLNHPCVSREVFLAKTRAAMDAASGTDFLNIARTETKLQYGIDEAIERCRRAVEIGAEMTLIIGLINQEEAEKVAKYVPGWKMWPDVMSKNGIPDVELDDIEPLGFNYVTAHMVTKGHGYGMREAGRLCREAKSLVPLKDFNMGYSQEEIANLMKFIGEPDQVWFEREAKYWEGL